MQTTLRDTILGTSSVGAIEVIPEVVKTIDISDPNIFQIVLQIIVAVATLVKMFKKPKPVNP